MKIKSLNISGFRGVRGNLLLPADGRSVLIYGDNGTGKSSISDAIEWFYYDKVDHLSGEEIGRTAYEALRNFLIKKEDNSTIEIEFLDNKHNSIKTIQIKKANYLASYSNSSSDFINYIKISAFENLILRYKQLINFVLSTKKQRLEALSDIIGFSEVSNIRDTLKSTFNKLNNEVKTKDIDGNISRQQKILLENIGQNIFTDNQFLECINEMITPLDLGKNLESINDVKIILDLLKDTGESALVQQQVLLTNIKEVLAKMPNLADSIEKEYGEYYSKYEKIQKDTEKLAKIVLIKLLSAGTELLSDGEYTDNICPLCLQHKEKDALLQEIISRLKDLEILEKEVNDLQKNRTNIENFIAKVLQSIDKIIQDKLIVEGLFPDIKVLFDKIKDSFLGYTEQINIEIAKENSIKSRGAFGIERSTIKTALDSCDLELKNIKDKISSNPKTVIYSKITLSLSAYGQIRNLKKEKVIIEKQRDSLGIIYSDFVKKQKESLELFLEKFSKDINDTYEFMNPHEQARDMKIIPIEKDDELVGITIQFKFYDNEVTPPQKFLSESHLNCFGLAFFLASVKAFNHNNKFFILDDVISSFDAEHRKRFADLLINNFQDYQIIVLTHERNWYEYMSNSVKNRWNVVSVKWNNDSGTYIDEPLEELLTRIERNLASGHKDGLGNDMRKYLEQFLKQLAHAVELKLKFQYNDKNEDRMAYELLTELKGKSKKSSNKLAENEIEQLLRSTYIANKDSHDSSYDPSIGDLKAFWREIHDLISIFCCSNCDKIVSLKYYDNINKTVRCRCGNVSYPWKL